MGVRHTLVANYLASAWGALMGLAFLPVYIAYLGVEAFGLIGAFAALQGWFVLLDLGLSPTLSREMARFSVGAHKPQGIRNILYTMEVIYLCVGLLLTLLVATSAHWLATNWFNAQQLPAATIGQALTIAGGVFGCRWMSTLYRSALLGLQKQIWLSVVNAVFATLRYAMVVFILAFISPTIEAFFAFQLIVGIAETLILGSEVRRSLPKPPERPAFSVVALRDVWRFAAGMTLITILSALLTQADKLMLSTLLPLSQFGYFTLATTMAGVLSLLTGPIANIAYPHFTMLVEQNSQQKLVERYHAFSQFLACLVFPAMLVLCVFAHEVVFVWTGNITTADAVAPLLSILVLGNALNSLMHTPYLAQLAYGWLRLTAVVNSVSVLVFLPALLVSVPLYGAMAAAWMWVAINLASMLFSVSVMHRRILRGELWRWCSRDLLLPLCSGGVVVAFSALEKSHFSAGSRVFDFFFVAITLLAAFIVTTLATPLGHNQLRMIMARYFKRTR